MLIWTGSLQTPTSLPVEAIFTALIVQFTSRLFPLPSAGQGTENNPVVSVVFRNLSPPANCAMTWYMSTGPLAGAGGSQESLLVEMLTTSTESSDILDGAAI